MHKLMLTKILVASASFAAVAQADPIDITHTHNGSAATLTGAGGFSMTGTIGQGAGVLEGGGFTLTSSLLDDSSSAPVCPADFNHDNLVDFFDYLDFVDAFSSDLPISDFNHDNTIDFFDYLDFVDALSAGC